MRVIISCIVTISLFTAISMSSSAQVLSGTLQDSINHPGPAIPGDTVHYKATLKNPNGSAALGVQYNNPTPVNTALLPGTRTSTLARVDVAAVALNGILSGGNVLTNDFGVPSPSVLTFGPTANPSATNAGNAGTTNGGGNLTVNANGTYTYTPVLNYTGNDQFTYIAGNGNLPNNAANVTISVGNPPTATNDAYNAVGNVSITLNAAAGVKANDGGGLTVVETVQGSAGNVGVSTATANGGQVTLQADGSFTYNPPAGFEGIDNFTYTVDNGFNQPASATVNITVAGMIWFVNNAAGAGGDGRLSTPFNTLPGLALINDGIGNHPADGDNIFLYGSFGTYQNGITLLNNQRLIGQAASASLSTITGLTPPSYSAAFPSMNPVPVSIVNVSSGNGVTLASNNTLRGITVQQSSGFAISGSGFGTLTVAADVSVNTAGQGLSLSTGDISGNFGDITSTGGTNNVVFNNCTGTTQFSGTLSGATGTSFSVSGGSISITKTGSLTQSNNALMINVSGGHSGTLTFQSGSLNASNGTGLNFSSADGIYNFQGTTTLSGGSARLQITSGSGTFDFNSNTLITNPATGAPFTITGGTASVTYSGNMSQSNNAALVSIGAGHTAGTVTFQTLALIASNGTGLQFDNADGTYNFNSTTILNGGAASIAIFNGSNGTFSFSSGTNITDPNGAPAMSITGGTAAVTYYGNLTMNTQNQPLVSITGGHSTGIVTFQNGTLGASSGNGLQFDNANSTYNFYGPVTFSTGGDAGIDILNGSSGTFNFSAASIINPTGTAFNIGGTATTASVTYTGSLIKNNAGSTVSISNHSTGTISFPAGGSISATTASAGNGIQFDNADGTYNFDASVNLSGGDAGIDVLNGSAGTISFTDATITDPSGTAINIGGTANTASFYYTGNVTKTNAGTLLSITNHSAGTVGFGAPGALTAGGASAGNGLQFDNADGSYFFNGSIILNGGDAGIDILNGSDGIFYFGQASISNPSGAAFNIGGTANTATATYVGTISKGSAGSMVSITNHSVGTVTFGAGGNLVATLGNGLQFDNADGTYTFNGTTNLSGGDAGIDILNGSGGTFTFSSNTNIVSPSGTAFNVNNSDAAVTYNGNISDNTGFLVDIDNHDANTITFQTGNLNSSGTGLRVQNCNGGTVNFDNASKTISTGSSAAVTLSNNTGSNINFRLSGLSIVTSSGTGFIATGGGTITVFGTGNIIQTSAGGTALNVANTTIGVGGMTFQTITSSGASSGIILNNTGSSGGLTVTGNGSSAGSGGSIGNSTGAGVSLTTTKDVNLGYMVINNSGTDGINANGVNGFTLNRSFIADAAGTSADEGIEFDNITGAVSITNTSISNSPHHNIYLDNQNTNLASFNISNSTLANTLTGTGADGLFFAAGGTSVIGQVTIATDTLSGNKSAGFELSAAGTSVFQSVAVTGCSFISNFTGVNLASSETGAITTFKIGAPGPGNVNTFRGQLSDAIRISSAATTTGGSITGKIQNNTIGVTGTFNSGSSSGSGINSIIRGGCAGSITVDANTINEVPNAEGIGLAGILTSGGSGGCKYKVTNNVVTRPTGATTSNCGGPPSPCPRSAIAMSCLAQTLPSSYTVCATISGNTAWDPTSWANGGGAAYYLYSDNAPLSFTVEGTNPNVATQITGTNTVTNLAFSPVNISGNVTTVAAGTCGIFE